MFSQILILFLGTITAQITGQVMCLSLYLNKVLQY